MDQWHWERFHATGRTTMLRRRVRRVPARKRNPRKAADGIRTHDLLHGKQRRQKRRLTTQDDETRLWTRFARLLRRSSEGPRRAVSLTFGPLSGHAEGGEILRLLPQPGDFEGVVRVGEGRPIQPPR